MGMVSRFLPFSVLLPGKGQDDAVNGNDADDENREKHLILRGDSAVQHIVDAIEQEAAVGGDEPTGQEQAGQFDPPVKSGELLFQQPVGDEQQDREDHHGHVFRESTSLLALRLALPVTSAG